MIQIPHALALDTAILAVWAHRWQTGDPGARRLVGALHRSTARLLLTLHHVTELLGHESDAVVESRARFVRTLEQIFWINALDGGPIGGVLDLHAIEIRARLDLGAVAFPQLLAAVRPVAVGFGGPTAVAALMEDETFVAASRQRIRQRRMVVSLSRTYPAALDPNQSLLPKSFDVPLSTVLARFDRQQDLLGRQLSTIGDPALAEPYSIARRFFDELREHAIATAERGSVNLATLLAQIGIDDVDLGREVSANMLGDKYVWRRRARLLARLAGVSPSAVEQLHPSAMPSTLLCDELSIVRTQSSRAAGGDFDDASLACLSLYAALTSVDKRTAEAIRQVRAHRPELDRVMSPIVKIPTMEALEASLVSFG